MTRIKKTLEQPTPVQTSNIQLPTGDLVPGEVAPGKKILPKLHRIAQIFGYDRVEPSPIEALDSFGQHEELLALSPDKYVRLDSPHGKRVGLRPQNFLGVLRAYTTHHVSERERMTKWYYIEPAFAQDKTALTHLYEFGLVNFGEASSVSDAHMIMTLRHLLQEFAIPGIVFEINSKGCESCGPYYEEVLSRFLQENKFDLCQDCQQLIRGDSKIPEIVSHNLLSVLSCAREECQTVTVGAPQIIDYLDAACNKQLTALLETLDELEVNYQLNPRLFGSPRHSHTLFKIKIQPSIAGEAEIDLGTGGRVTRFVGKIAGQPIHTLHYSLPLQALYELIAQHGAEQKYDHTADVFLINLGDLAAKKSLRLFQELLRNDISVAEHFGENGIKNQFKLAEKRGCLLALLIGQKEALEGNVILRDVRSGIQEVFASDRILEEVRKRLQD